MLCMRCDVPCAVPFAHHRAWGSGIRRGICQELLRITYARMRIAFCKPTLGALTACQQSKALGSVASVVRLHLLRRAEGGAHAVRQGLRLIGAQRSVGKECAYAALPLGVAGCSELGRRVAYTSKKP